MSNGEHDGMNVSTAPGVKKKSSTSLPFKKVHLLLLLELLFILFPLIVVVLIYYFNEHLAELFKSSEWSFAATLLFCQGFFKLITGVVEAFTIRAKSRSEAVGEEDNSESPLLRLLLLTGVVVLFGIVPSIVILTSILNIELRPQHGNNAPEHTLPMNLIIAQIVWFVLGLVTFYALGGVGELIPDWMHRRLQSGSQDGEGVQVVSDAA